MLRIVAVAFFGDSNQSEHISKVKSPLMGKANANNNPVQIWIYQSVLYLISMKFLYIKPKCFLV